MESQDQFQTIAGIRLPIKYQDKFHHALLEFLNERWSSLLPSPLSEQSGAKALIQEDGYVLVVAARHSVLLNEIEWHKTDLLKAIGELLDSAIIRIKDIAFRVDPYFSPLNPKPKPEQKPANNHLTRKNASLEVNYKDKYSPSPNVTSLTEQIEQQVKDHTLRDILTKMSRYIDEE